VIQSLVTDSLFARSESIDLVVNDLTIQLPTTVGVTVNASTAMSSFAPGAKILVDVSRDWIGGRLGVGAAIIYAYTRRGTGGIETIKPSLDIPVNQRRITRCISVTFRAAASLSEINALTQIVVFDPANLQITTRYIRRVAVAFDPSGWIRYVHTERAPGPKFRKSDSQFRREALVAAKRALGSFRINLDAVVTTGRPPKPGFDHIDRRSKRTRKPKFLPT